MRRIIALLAIYCSMTAMAQTSIGFETLVLTFIDGSYEEISLTDDVVVKPTGAELIIKIKGVQYVYDRSDVLSIKYNEAFTGIEDVIVDDSSIKIIDNTVAFNGLKDDNTINVFSVDGRLIATRSVSPDDNHVNFSFLSPGVYIIQSKYNGTHKIVVR